MIAKYSETFPSLSYATAGIATALAGLLGSIALTTDPRWMEWHMSRLGEGNHFSSYIFNGSLILIAFFVLAFASTIVENLQTVSAKHDLTWFLKLMYLMCGCLIGVGLCPFDRLPVLHNIFGYGFFTATILVMMRTRQLLPGLSNIVYRYGSMAAGFTTLLMVLHHLINLTTLLVVELTGEGLLFVWLLMVAYEVDQSSKPAASFVSSKFGVR